MKRLLLFPFLLGNSLSLFSMNNQTYNVTFTQANNNYSNKENVASAAFLGQFGLNFALFANQPLFESKSSWNHAQRDKISLYWDDHHNPLIISSMIASIPLSLVASKYPTNAYMWYMSGDSKQAARNLGIFAGLVANQVLLSAGPAQIATLPSPVKSALYTLSTTSTLHVAHQQFKKSSQHWQNSNYLAAAGHLTLSGLYVGAAGLPFYLDYSHRKMS